MAQRTCPSCGVSAPPDARFCGSCGEVLTVAPRPDRDAHGSRPRADDDVAGTVGARSAGPDPRGEPHPVATVVGSEGDDDATRSPRRRRGVLVALALAALLAVVLAVVTPGPDAIVVGDGLVLPSGAGPTDVPERTWRTTVDLGGALPPLAVGETLLVAGSDRGAAVVVGLDRTTGRRLWRTAVEEAAPVALHPAGEDAVVTVGGGGETRVVRLAGRTGDVVWSRPLDGDPTRALGLADGASVVLLAGAGPPRAVVVDPGGEVVVEHPATRAAASSELVALRTDGLVATFETAGTPLATIEDAPPGDGPVAVVDDVVVAASDAAVVAFDAFDGELRWERDTTSPVAALTAAAGGIGVVTLGRHVGLSPDGEELWRSRGYPVPLVRDGRAVTALVAPGRERAVEVGVVDDQGRTVLPTTATDGTYVALGGDTLFTAAGDEVLGTSLDDDRTGASEPGADVAPTDGAGPSWAVETDGEVVWLVLDGPTMVALSDTGGDVTVSSWR